MTDKPHLVWYESTTGRYWPQKWFVMEFGVNGWRKQHVKATHELSGKLAELPIDDLVKLFPPPPREGDES